MKCTVSLFLSSYVLCSQADAVYCWICGLSSAPGLHVWPSLGDCVILQTLYSVTRRVSNDTQSNVSDLNETIKESSKSGSARDMWFSVLFCPHSIRTSHFFPYIFMLLYILPQTASEWIRIDSTIQHALSPLPFHSASTECWEAKGKNMRCFHMEPSKHCKGKCVVPERSDYNVFFFRFSNLHF